MYNRERTVDKLTNLILHTYSLFEKVQKMKKENPKEYEAYKRSQKINWRVDKQ